MTALQDDIRRIAEALSTLRTPATPGEFDLHASVSEALKQAGLAHQHEFRLAPRCRIDFLVGRIGLEIKKGRPVPSALRAQLRRYLECDALDAIIVVTQRAIFLPRTLCGKPVEQISLNRLWGVALP